MVPRTVFNNLFEWMVYKASMKMQIEAKAKRINLGQENFIGVLDIFGFEFYNDEDLKSGDGPRVGEKHHRGRGKSLVWCTQVQL